MNETEARQYRADYDQAVRELSRMTRASLKADILSVRRTQGIISVFGGPVSKDELIREALDLRGFTTAKHNETTHVLYHRDAAWDGCQSCALVSAS